MPFSAETIGYRTVFQQTQVNLAEYSELSSESGEEKVIFIEQGDRGFFFSRR